MPALRCPRCRAEVGRLIIRGELGCDLCLGPAQALGNAGCLHVRVGNKHYPKMTQAMQQNILTRQVFQSKETGQVRALPDKRWQSRWGH